MSDFLIYAARLQDAGVEHLSVRIWTDKDRTRMMRVTPHGSYPKEMQDRWPWRDFELCGTDRVLERLKDDMAYSDDGPTPEKLQAAIDANPWHAEDLREWYADWTLIKEQTEEEMAAAEAGLDEAEIKRSAQRVKDILRGMNIGRNRDAMKTPNSNSTTDSVG